MITYIRITRAIARVTTSVAALRSEPAIAQYASTIVSNDAIGYK